MGLGIALVMTAAFSWQTTHAATYACGTHAVMGNSAPYWGNNSGTNVNASKGAPVRISIKGEDGCAGQSATFVISKSGKAVRNAVGTLVQGAAVSGQTGAYVFSADWANDLDNGDYTVKLLSVAGQVMSSTESPNTLSIQVAQACNLSKVYASPNGGQPGDKIQLIAEVQGACVATPPWKVSLNAIDDLNPGAASPPFVGTGQDVTSSNKVIWEWTLPSITVGATQNPYHLEAHMGSQTVKSNPFLDTRAPCVAGQCPLAPNTDNFNTTVPAGQNNTFTFNITNPLNGGPNNLFDIIDIATKWLLQLSIPLAVLWIMYAGFLMLTAGDKPANFEKGKKVLTYTVLGLAIIFIGRGFITLIVSVIQLGGSSPTTTQAQPQTQSSTSTDTGPHVCVNNTCINGVTGPCTDDSQCVVSNDAQPVQPGDACAASDQQPCGSTLVCGSQGMCQYPGGNHTDQPCYTDANCQSGTTCKKNPLGAGNVCVAN